MKESIIPKKINYLPHVIDNCPGLRQVQTKTCAFNEEDS